MKKPTLKHLAPYLPYKLKMKFHEGNGDPQLLTAISIGHNNSLTLKFIDRYGKPSQWKLILRPLSDLTKEIEINKIKLIPSELIESKFIKRFKFKAIGGNWETNLTDYLYSYPYGMIDLLFQWHFDVFGLIPEGLAIDINTL